MEQQQDEGGPRGREQEYEPGVSHKTLDSNHSRHRH
jgi:hypothetical protein